MRIALPQAAAGGEGGGRGRERERERMGELRGGGEQRSSRVPRGRDTLGRQSPRPRGRGGVEG